MSDTIWLSSLQQKIHQSFFKLCSIITTFVTNTNIHTTYGCLNQHHSQVSLCTFDYIHIFQKYFMVVLLYLDVLILHLKCKKFIFCAFSMLLLLKAHNKNFWGAKSGLVCQRPTVKSMKSTSRCKKHYLVNGLIWYTMWRRCPNGIWCPLNGLETAGAAYLNHKRHLLSDPFWICW